MLEIRLLPQDTTGAGQIAYNNVYSRHDLAQLDSFYLWLMDLLAPEPGCRLLDVSCGSGRMVYLAQQQGVRAHGVDLSDVAARSARRLGCVVGVGDGEKLPYPDATFDCLTHIGSLEHYLRPALGAAEITRVLKPGGRACVLLPNTFGLFTNIWTAWRTGRPYVDDQPIQRYASRYEWQDLLQAAGLTIFRTVKYERETPRSLSDLRWYTRHPRALARLVLTPLVPLNLASCLVYLCRRVES